MTVESPQVFIAKYLQESSVFFNTKSSRTKPHYTFTVKRKKNCLTKVIWANDSTFSHDEVSNRCSSHVWVSAIPHGIYETNY